MECQNCHAENKENSRFCGNCTTPLDNAGPEPSFLTKTLATPLSVVSMDSLIADKYSILAQIGRGGMEIVYKAEDIKMKRSAAMKFLPPYLVDAPELTERLLIEAQAAAALNRTPWRICPDGKRATPREAKEHAGFTCRRVARANAAVHNKSGKE